MGYDHPRNKDIRVPNGRYQHILLRLLSVLVVSFSHPKILPSQLTLDRICSLLTMEPAAYATYKLQVQGLFFLGLILGTVFAEILCSGRLSDWLMIFLAKRNNGVRSPEMRLWLGYPAAILSSLGLLIWGLSIDKDWHWVTGQIAFFLCR
jgi:hypothetical protein